MIPGYKPGSGNTSACAEKRVESLAAYSLLWKYLRVCGEEVHSRRLMSVEGKYLRVCGEEPLPL